MEKFLASRYKWRACSKDLWMRRIVRSPFLTVIVVVALAFGIFYPASGRYQRSILRAREATCREEMFVVNQAVKQYTLDKQRPPGSLQELVKWHYLLAIPQAPCERELDSPPVLGDPIPNPNFSVSRPAGVN
jgi:hypothetical protein